MLNDVSSVHLRSEFDDVDVHFFKSKDQFFSNELRLVEFFQLFRGQMGFIKMIRRCERREKPDDEMLRMREMQCLVQGGEIGF